MEGRCTTAQVTLRILPAWEGVEEWVSCATHHRYHFLQYQGPRGKDRSLRLNKQKKKKSKQTLIYGAAQLPKYVHNSADARPSRSLFVWGENDKKWKKKGKKRERKNWFLQKIEDEKKGNHKRGDKSGATGTQCVPSVFAKTVESPYICRWQETVQGCFIQYIVEAPIEIYPTCSSSFSWDPVSVTAKKFLNSW